MNTSSESPDRWPAEPDTETLETLRRKIDAVDAELLDALNRRAQCSLEVGRLKARSGGAIHRPDREQALMEAITAQNPGPLPDEHVRAVFRVILASSRALQRREQTADAPQPAENGIRNGRTS